MIDHVQTKKILSWEVFSCMAGSWGQVALEETYLLLKRHSIVQYFRND